MSVIDSLLPNLDTILGVRDSAGLALKPVFLVSRTWSGEAPGDGEAREEVVQMLPTPQILNLSHSVKLTEGGNIRQGDIILKMVSKASFPDYNYIRRKSPSANVELFYQVGEELYHVISVVEKHLTYDIQLRLISDQTRYQNG